MKIGYLGPSGSHSQMAAELFANQCVDPNIQNRTLFPMMTLTHILEAVEEEAIELGCVPVENSLEGAVTEVLDSLAFSLEKTAIIAEFVRPVQHALIRKYPFIEGITYVHSHPQAIGQCREAIYELLGPNVKFVPTSSTSEAVKDLASLDETHAALGSVKAAERYGMEVLVENIGNMSHNATRFLALSAVGGQELLNPMILSPARPMKTSLCVGLHQNKPGALLEILTILARFQLNMTRIESRPTKKNLGEYLFYLDIEGSIPKEVETLLREQTSLYKCLGIYPVLGMLL